MFREEQQFRQRWLLVLVLGLAGLTWWTVLRQFWFDAPVGEGVPTGWVVWVMWAIVGVAMPLLFLRAKLITEVHEDGVMIRFFPFPRRFIPLAEIEQVEVRSYSALKEYGGWGIKGWSANNVAYNVSGGTGVQLTLGGPRRVLVGSQKAEELAEAIETQRRGGTRRKGFAS